MLVRNIILATLGLVSLGASIEAQANLSAYDSMYFPTTQSLEGSRRPATIYSVLKVNFGRQKSSKPKYFTDFKRTYYSSQNIAALPMFPTHSNETDITVVQPYTSTLLTANAVSYSDSLEALNDRVYSRLSLTPTDPMQVIDNPSSLDDMNAMNFDFGDAKGNVQTSLGIGN